MVGPADEPGPDVWDQDNPYDPPSVAYREKLGAEERGDFKHLSTKELARLIGDVQVVRVFGGIAVTLGVAYLLCFIAAYLCFLLVGGRNAGEIDCLQEFVKAMGACVFLTSLGSVVVCRGVWARSAAILFLLAAVPVSYVLLGAPGALLFFVFFLPVSAVAIGPIVRNERTFGPGRIKKEELKLMRKEFAFRRKNRVV